MSNFDKQPEEPEEKFRESADLKALAKEILSADTPELRDARSFQFSVIFTTQRLVHHKAAYCRRLDGPIAFKTKLDYIIVVGHQHFMKVKPAAKAAIIVHELNHIKAGDRNGEPSIREHDGDFCEIPEHDKFSSSIVARIIDRLPTLAKIPYQTTLEEQGKIP